MQGHLLEGLAKANTGMGSIAEKIPIIEKTPIDEGLSKVGDVIADFKDDSIDKKMSKLITAQNSQVQPFIDSIVLVDARLS